MGFINGIVLATVVFCGYEAVHLGGMQAAGFAFIALNWTTMLIIYLEMLADINNKSALFLQNAWKMAARLDSGMDRRALGKELGSMVELRVKLRDVFYYDKGIVLTTIEVIFVNTINMILAG